MSNPVFVDPSGRRARHVHVAALAFGLVVSVLGTLFLVSLAVTAVSRPARMAGSIARNVLDQERRKAMLVSSRLRKRLEAESAPAPPAELHGSNTVNMAFYAPWEETGLASFRANASHLTHVAPVWLHLAPDGRSVDQTDFDPVNNPANSEVIEVARSHGVRIVPLISNAGPDGFDRRRMAGLLADPAAQVAMATWLRDWCKANGFQGLNLDFEELPEDAGDAYTALLNRFHGILAPAGLELSIDAETSATPDELAAWAAPCDYIVLMAYDQHDEKSGPGPIAAAGWVEQNLRAALKKVPRDKFVMGLGSYAYDWKGGKAPAESITFQEAMAQAQGADTDQTAAIVDFDPDSMNTTFQYDDEDDAHHTVWLLDAPSVYNDWQVARSHHPRGAALWCLGTEDPTVWNFLDHRLLGERVSPKLLQEVQFPFEVSYAGKGEVLDVISRPSPGNRTISTDLETGFIDEVVYHSYATTYLIRKRGFVPNKVVLTFDDGPDPRWTPGILDVLRRYHAPAVFFFVGANVESYPDIVSRAYREGHEIGSHSFTHPNLGAVTERRAELELTSTQRLLESVIGCSTLLFRPPYNADSQPRTVDEVRPVDIADRLGYVTVGENVDPNDWDPTLLDAAGRRRPRKADDIVRLVMEDLARRKGTGEEGNMVLLHDAGGIRAETVKALPALIVALRKAGYELTTVGGLLGQPRSKFMPPIPPSDRRLVGVDRVVFTVLHTCQELLIWGFLAAIFLGTLRVLLTVPLALAHARRRKQTVFDPTYKPRVAVVIAAYNEETTIGSTLASVLACDYPIESVIVVDDGSADDTSGAVTAVAARDGRVRLVRKPNGGKASALNLGLAETDAELIFSIDADTQLDPRAIGKLARHFSDSSLAAVAGNVQVGNVVNVLTAWQGVEYRTSQNLDRRAYALLNAITVIPGAIGMWRHEAVQKAGGYTTDTLAEDMDLTWRLRKLGYRCDTEPEAISFTEAPETWKALVKQRFRWAYGTLQCLWKHRDALGKHEWFGRLILPLLWVFQIGFQILGPLVDIQILVTAVLAAVALVSSPSREMGAANQIDSLRLMLELYALFFCLEMGTGLIAYRMDRARPWPLFWLFVQRFAYRQLMYAVMIKALVRAATGHKQGWGKLKRTGGVKLQG